MAAWFGSALILPGPFPAPRGFMEESGERDKRSGSDRPGVIFATFAESEEQLAHTVLVVESIRTFGGRFADAPIYVFAPSALGVAESIREELDRRWQVEIRRSDPPQDATWLYFSSKVYAAGKAEAEAEEAGAVLAWMDEDTIVLQEPAAVVLPEGVGLAYRPVMHNRSGTLYGKPPNEFWRRIYEVLKIDDSLLFPMVTPADGQKINAYFNAGLLIVRPEHGILRAWGSEFTKLYRDPVLAEMCRTDITHRIFLHQTALVGAVLHRLEPSHMVELDETYNYPIFFKQMYGANQEFDDIGEAVTLRYDVYFRDPDPDWSSRLRGPAEKVAWLAKRLGKDRTAAD